MPEETTLERFIRVATHYRLADDETLKYFVKFVSGLEVRERAALLDDPVWVVGFVSGIVYARFRESGSSPSRSDIDTLHKIMIQTLSKLQHIPYTGSKN